MTIIDRYIFREFFKFFLLILAVFAGLFFVIEFFEKARMFLSNNASVYQMAAFFIYRFPFMASQMIPVAVLIASLVTFSTLSRHSEATAMKASGVSLYRASAPVITAAIVVSACYFFITEFVTPKANERADEIKYVEIQNRTVQGSFKQDQIWYRGEGVIYNFKYFDPDNNILKGIIINKLDPHFKLEMRVDAESAEWKNESWLFSNILITRFDKDGVPYLERKSSATIAIPEKPQDFKIVQKDADKMGYLELDRYVRKMRSEGYDVSKYLTDLHGKIAFTVVSLIMAVIGISFSLRSERSGGIALSIGAGIIIGFSYWIVHAIFMSLGHSGSLTPVLSAWSADVLFAIAAVVMYSRVRT